MIKIHEKINFIIEDSKIGVKTLIAQKNNTKWYLHSSYNPILQAQQFAELNYSTESNILLYGLGLGYHIRAMLDLMDSSQKLYVLETSREIYDLFLEIGTANIINDDRLVIMVPKSVNEIDFFLKGLPMDLKILYYTPSVKLIENDYEFLRTWLNNHRLDMNTSVFFGKMNENHKINTQLDCKNFLQLFEERYFNIPCLIVASGPSLKDVEDFLKEAKGNCIIISIGRNSSFFKELDIEPTIFIEIDCQDIVAERFENYNFKCPLVFLSTVSNRLPAIYRGPKSIIYVRKGIADKYVVEGGGSTVAAIALELAAKMGCNPIGMVAQDLVFDGTESHFNGGKIHINADTMHAQVCNDGEMRYTSKSFMRHKASIENVVSRYLNAHHFFSLTRKGICINNANFMEPELFLNRYGTEVGEIEDEIKSKL